MRDIAASEGAIVVPICAAIEAEIAQLEEADRAEFLAELNADPEYVKRRTKQEDERVLREAEIALMTRPLLHELRTDGYPLTTIGELLPRYAPLPDKIVQILLSWLPKLSDVHVKEHLIRALAAPAQPFDGGALVRAFEETDSKELQYAVANTLAEARATGVTEWVLRTTARPEVGRPRELLALAAARLAGEDANPILLGLLEELPAHAALALTESGAEPELRALEARYATAEGWVKQQIGRSISVIRGRIAGGRKSE